MTQALILVDIQNDYFPNGAMELVHMDRSAENAAALLARFRENALPVVHIRHIAAREGATFFLPGTKGSEIHVSVQPLNTEDVIIKHYPNSFRETDLQSRLREKGTESLVICGAMSHMCIDATTRAAFDLGFDCTVVENACATRDLEFQDRTIAAADVHGGFMAALAAVYARVVSTRQFLSQ